MCNYLDTTIVSKIRLQTNSIPVQKTFKKQVQVLMNMEINGFAATRPESELTPHEYQDTLESGEVAIEITHCGICHSDIHLIDNEWGMSDYPFIPGHEIVGRVVEAGNDSRLSEGDRVGVGWQCGSCHSCEHCEAGEQHNCAEQEATCVGRNGGYADTIVVDSGFAFKLPDSLDSATTAPMMCGGITVYTPLSKYTSSGDHVAVLGLGGLGHFAVKFAAAMGHEVTVLSTSPSKREAAKELGADRLVDTTKEGALDELRGTFDCIINTAPASLDWEAYIATLAPNGVFAQVGAAPQPLEVSAFSLLAQDKQVVGSHIGSPDKIREMLRFAAQNDVEATIQAYNMKDVNEALDHVRRGDAQFRVVLQNEE